MTARLNVMSETRPANRLAPDDGTGDWRERSACDDTTSHLFYGPSNEDTETAQERNYRVAAARAICADCPVAQQCVAQAVDDRDTWGIRGGLTTRELNALLPKPRKLPGTGPAPTPPAPTRAASLAPAPTTNCPRPTSITIKMHGSLGERPCAACHEHRTRTRGGKP